MWNEVLKRVLLSSAIALALVAPIRGTGAGADVTINFLADGRCAVSAKGEGFRSNATYKPDPAKAAGDRRCAMPPVPPGRTVALRVSLPSGTAKPGASTPALNWTEDEDAWVGTASLTEWPDAVVVSPASTRLLQLSLIGAGLLAVAAALGLRRNRSQHQTAV